MENIRVAKLTKKLERGLLKSREIFEALDPHQWEQRISDDAEAWTVREFVVHFIYSEEHLLRIAQDIASGGGGAPEDIDLDEFNQNEMEKFPHIPISDLLNLLTDTRRKTLDWVRELDNSTLDMMGQHPTLGTSSVETAIFSIYAHQLLHMRETVPNLEGE